LLPTGGLEKWLSWPISRDSWLNQFGSHAFKILLGEIGIDPLFKEDKTGAAQTSLKVKPMVRIMIRPSSFAL